MGICVAHGINSWFSGKSEENLKNLLSCSDGVKMLESESPDPKSQMSSSSSHGINPPPAKYTPLPKPVFSALFLVPVRWVYCEFYTLYPSIEFIIDNSFLKTKLLQAVEIFCFFFHRLKMHFIGIHCYTQYTVTYTQQLLFQGKYI